jgi:uncharacterized membrane protein YoaK (UPF0700 family)
MDVMTSSFLREAWRTVVPGPDDPYGPLPAVLIVLTVFTGVTDAYSFLSLGHVFVANMTGNVLFVAFSLAGTSGFSRAASLTALAAFLLGAALGGQVSRLGPTHHGRRLLVLNAMHTVLVVAAFGYAELVPQPVEDIGRWVLIALTGLGMGLQAALVRRIGVPDLTTTVITTTLTSMAVDGRLGGGRYAHAGRRTASVLALILGALIGALITRFADPRLNLALCALLLAAVTVAALPLARSTGDWARARE